MCPCHAIGRGSRLVVVCWGRDRGRYLFAVAVLIGVVGRRRGF